MVFDSFKTNIYLVFSFQVCSRGTRRPLVMGVRRAAVSDAARGNSIALRPRWEFISIMAAARSIKEESSNGSIFEIFKNLFTRTHAKYNTCTTCIKRSTHQTSGVITYLLTPCCRVLPEQLTGLQLVNKFPAFHGIPRFITALTNVRHLSLSWARPIQSIYPHPTSWRSILI